MSGKRDSDGTLEGPPERGEIAAAALPAKQNGNVANCSPLARQRKHARKKEVLRWLMEGLPTPAVVDQGRRLWGAGSRTMQRYISEVRKEWLPALYDLADLQAALVEELARSELLYARCLQHKDMRAAVQTRKWIGELRGLTKEQRMKDEADMLRAEIRRLRDKQGKPEQDGGGNAKVGLSLERFNEMRRIYNQQPWPEELWDLYHANNGVLSAEEQGRWAHLLPSRN